MATVLCIKKEKLVEEDGLKAFLRAKLSGLNAGITTIYLKYAALGATIGRSVKEGDDKA